MSGRILFVTFIPDMSRPSGYRARVLAEMETVRRWGYRPFLLALTPLQTLGRGPARRAFRRELERRGLEGCMFPHAPSLRSTFGKRWMSWTGSAAIAAWSRTLNVAVVHGESQPATVAALTARALTRVPVVYDAHGVGPEEVELDGVSRGVPRKRVVAEVSLAREWERRCWWASDAVVAVSSALVRHLTETYGPRDRAIVIPCATDAFPTSDRSCRSAVRKELGVADRDVFTYVGSLAPYQLAPDTLRWFAQVRQRRPSAFLLVVSQASRDAWDRLAREAGVPDHAYRVVAAPHHQVPDYVAAADVGLMLRAESAVNRVAFPTKLAEYLAAGVPVVTTDALHDPAKLVKDHRLGLVLPAGAVPDVDAIERFILVVREDREGWFRRCRGVAADLLTWPRYADRLLAAYAAALSKAQPDHRWFDGFAASSPARAEDGG